MRFFFRSPHAKKFVKAWDETLELARLRLHEAARGMKKWANQGRWDAHFSVGDMVFLKITGEQFQPAKGTTSKLSILMSYSTPFLNLVRVGARWNR